MIIRNSITIMQITPLHAYIHTESALHEARGAAFAADLHFLVGQVLYQFFVLKQLLSLEMKEHLSVVEPTLFTYQHFRGGFTEHRSSCLREIKIVSNLSNSTFTDVTTTAAAMLE